LQRRVLSLAATRSGRAQALDMPAAQFQHGPFYHTVCMCLTVAVSGSPGVCSPR
jgi:hypothetical protein